MGSLKEDAKSEISPAKKTEVPTMPHPCPLKSQAVDEIEKKLESLKAGALK